jgi:hypothetical protein
MLTKIMIAAALAGAVASPALAQSYSAAYGTGNVIDQPSLERSSGMYGYGDSVAPARGSSAYVNRQSTAARGLNAFAFAPEQGRHQHKRAQKGQ